jgi:F420-dependent oxidoreductase-like protein
MSGAQKPEKKESDMRLGINGTGLVQKASVQAIVDHARRAQEDGFSSYWLAEHPTGGLDAITVLSLVGQTVPKIELGTAIVPTYPRHPMALAGQALTAHSVLPGRFTLGIGLSHAPMMAQLGIGFEKPIRHLREFLSVLVPLLSEGRVAFEGETIACKAEVFGPPAEPCRVVVAALGPQALKVAGARTSGTTLAWVGPKTIREHIVPRISEAAEIAGREPPRIIATLPVCVTDEEEIVRGLVAQGLSMYAKLPSYRAMFEREGVKGPGDLVLAGNEDRVGSALDELVRAGVTDFAASEFVRNSDEFERTRSFLKSALGAS